MHRLRAVLVLSLALLILLGTVGAAHAAQPPVSGKYYGVGYWKNHSEYWPDEPINVGWTSYAKAELEELFAHSPKGDVSYLPAQQMAAAMLNAQNGGEMPFISPHQMVFATMWIINNPPGSGLSESDPQWTAGASGWSGAALTSYLEYYNANGRPPLP